MIYADYKKIVNLFIQALHQIFQNYVSANTCKAERDLSTAANEASRLSENLIDWDFSIPNEEINNTHLTQDKRKKKAASQPA